MRIPGKRIPRTRLVRTDDLVVAVEVEAVIPDADPTEPCFEAETIELLREVESRAKDHDIDWLKRHGKVYAALDAA
jgi:hypothetical protein